MILNDKDEYNKKFEDLIGEGNNLILVAQSLRGSIPLDKLPSEKPFISWAIKTRTFLIFLFGEEDINVKSFRKCFKSYELKNLFDVSYGKIQFTKEDMSSAVGILEAIYSSFKDGYLNRKEELIKALEKTKDKIKTMFDNNILNKIIDGELDLEGIIKSDKFEFYATHIQVEEYASCNDEERRKKLAIAFSKLQPNMISTESGIWELSRWGEFKWSGSNSKIEVLKQGNNKHNSDALIGEVAIKKDILLVTNDKTLKSRVNENGGRAINLNEFKELLNEKIIDE